LIPANSLIPRPTTTSKTGRRGGRRHQQASGISARTDAGPDVIENGCVELLKKRHVRIILVASPKQRGH